MDVLLAPVFEYFLSVRQPCLDSGGFVVGPMGMNTAQELFEFAIEAGTRDKEVPYRFTFEPWLAGAVYESHVEDGRGAFRYMGLIDEIEINNDGHRYRERRMKPGEGMHGEERYDERMPAFVRFRVLKPVGEVMPGSTHLWPRDLGLSEMTLRKFKIGDVRKTRRETGHGGKRAAGNGQVRFFLRWADRRFMLVVSCHAPLAKCRRASSFMFSIEGLASGLSSRRMKTSRRSSG